jgi:hypothetical protein
MPIWAPMTAGASATVPIVNRRRLRRSVMVHGPRRAPRLTRGGPAGQAGHCAQHWHGPCHAGPTAAGGRRPVHSVPVRLGPGGPGLAVPVSRRPGAPLRRPAARRAPPTLAVSAAESVGGSPALALPAGTGTQAGAQCWPGPLPVVTLLVVALSWQLH